MLLTAAALLLSLPATIDQKRVHLIDAYPRGPTPHNFIFRGNNPTNKSSAAGEDGKYQFDYDGLVAAMRTAASTCSVTLPKELRIVDVSLENPTDPGYFVEHQFWNRHADLGELIQWTTLGSLLDVKVTPFKEQLVKNGSWAIQGDADRLPERLAAIHSALTNTSGPPTAFFVHCNAGCDRTGEFIGAYAMSYLGYNVTTAMGEAQKQCGRTPNFFASESLGWWCLTLKPTRPDIGDCVDAFGCKYLGDCDTHNATTLADACPR